MSHLSSSEFVDLAEQTLEPRRAAHAETCAACRAQASIVRDALQATRAAGAVPEPSPLFWDHLSARVRDGIARQPPRRFGLGWGFRGFQPDVAVVALAVVIFSVTYVTREWRRAAPPDRIATASVPVPGEFTREPDLGIDVNDVEAWAVLTAAAEDVHLEDARAAGMAVQPAAVDRAVQRLTTEELTELGRLLQSELKRSSD
jgi:hypothetical protein